jgi:transposase
LFIRDPKQLTTEEQAEIELICQYSETARTTYSLTQQFLTMLRKRRGQEFETWLSAVEASHIPELCRFAESLLKDKDAVLAGLTLSYSNGPVEAQVQKRETWSSDRCMVVPNFLCYGNACSMRLDRYRAFHSLSFLFPWCFLFLLLRILSSTEADVDEPHFLLVEGRNFFASNGTSSFL